MRNCFFTYSLSILLLTSCNPEPIPKASTSPRHEVKIAIHEDPETLDPRLVRNTLSTNVSHMLFEGLMRINFQGHVAPAIAKEYVISEEGRRYTFTLRESHWSDGSPLTAHDFEYAWKSSLSPSFPAPNAYQLYVLKGGKEAKEGKAPLSDVGVKAVDDHTLVVDLEEPLPYFLSLTASHFFYPINRAWSEKKGASPLVSNGPFQFERWKRGEALSFTKNSFFWDKQNTEMERISLLIMEDNIALKVFEKRGVDWAGSPMSAIPADALLPLKMEGKLHMAPAVMTRWIRLNTKQSPFNHVEIRQAFNLAINRKAIVDYITAGIPATGIVPLSMGLQTTPYFTDGDIPAAWSSFQEGLKKMGISKDEFPKITLCYAPNDQNRKMAQTLQQQWLESLGVEVLLEPCEMNLLYDKLSQGNYAMSLGSWVADIQDPTNFLDVFKTKDNGRNNTSWESPLFIDLLNRSGKVTAQKERLDLLKAAEKHLMDEVPVIPLIYGTFNYVKNRALNGVYVSDLGYLDLRYAYKEE